VRETEEGSLAVTIQQATANANAGDGIQFRESDAGT
jgi:hypothetical protein